MKALVVLCGLLSFQAWASPGKADPMAPFRFDSDTAIAMDGTVPELVVRTDRTDQPGQRAAIEAQLFFLVGSMNQYHSAADLGHADVKILQILPLAGTKTLEIHYSAKLLVGWDKKTALPASLPLVLPARVDEEAKAKYFGAYAKTCSENPNDSDLSVESFYYYYRPEKEGCELFKTHLDPEVAGITAMTFKPSGTQSQGKLPEYGKIWEDGKLVVTMIFGTYAVGASGNGDSGINAYNNMYRSLRRRFGKPDYQNVSVGGFLGNGVPGKSRPDVEMEWRLPSGGTLNANILLVDKEGLLDPTETFAARYNARTQISDYVSYNGHSGFGANIQALAKMGSFRKGQWQLYLVNGCDTFFYVDDSLRAAHEAANPGSAPYEFFNIVTNALPAPFNALPGENMSVIEAFLGKKATYRQILSQFAVSQHAIVTGEENNKWPN